MLVSGLEKLEYRGYDSAGLAVIQNNQIHNNEQVDVHVWMNLVTFCITFVGKKQCVV